VASVLVSMRTHPRSPVIPRLSPASASAISSTVMSVKPVEALSSGTTRSPGVAEAEKEFVAEIVDSFYKSLKRSVALVLKGSTISFFALKVVLSRNIESIRDFGGDDQAVALELLVARFERDVDEWRCLSNSDLGSSVNEQLERLAAQMREAQLAVHEAAKEMIKRANLLLSKAEPVRLEEIARLEQLKTQNDEIL